MSQAEETLAVQLEQAGIPFEREYRFAPPRRWRADFAIQTRPLAFTLTAWGNTEQPRHPAILVEIDGGGYVAGRHSRGRGMERDAEKQSAAAILGYRVIRATPSQVNEGIALGWIRAALGLAEKAA